MRKLILASIRSRVSRDARDDSAKKLALGRYRDGDLYFVAVSLVIEREKSRGRLWTRGIDGLIFRGDDDPARSLATTRRC